MRQLGRWAFVICMGFAAPSWAFVDANTASAADLSSIKGLGPSTSQRLIQARQSQPFETWDDLIQRTPGIGPATAQKLSAGGLRVRGQPYTTGDTKHAAGGQVQSGEAIWRPMVPKPVPPR